MNSKKYAAAGALVALMLMPAAASAQATSSNPLTGQVLTLMQQIKALQDQLKSLLGQMGSSTKGMMGDDMNRGQLGKMLCIELKRDIKQGMQGDDVKSIQQMLSEDKDSDFHGGITGFFGPMTARAFAKFQMNNGIASSSDGTAGPRTRAFFERRCGKGMGMGGEGKNGDDKHGMDMMMLMGTIASFDGTTLTVSGPNNNSKSFTVSSTTKIEVGHGTSSPATTGSTADLTVGAKVMVKAGGTTGGTAAAEAIRVGDFPMPMNMQGGQGMMNIPGMGMLKNMMWGADDHKPEGQGGSGKPQNY